MKTQRKIIRPYRDLELDQTTSSFLSAQWVREIER